MAFLSAILPLVLPRDESGSEQRLIARARANDRAAFQRIFERHADAVHGFLRDQLGEAAAADEGTQEVFFRAYHRLDTLRETDKLLPWLLGIARNVSLEVLRARRRSGSQVDLHAREEGSAEPPALGPELHAPNPETLLLDRETEARLAGALATLAEGRRTALLLRIDHGLSYDEIADFMGWSLSKVKVELHRARAQLRAELSREEGGRR